MLAGLAQNRRLKSTFVNYWRYWPIWVNRWQVKYLRTSAPTFHGTQLSARNRTVNGKAMQRPTAGTSVAPFRLPPSVESCRTYAWRRQKPIPVHPASDLTESSVTPSRLSEAGVTRTITSPLTRTHEVAARTEDDKSQWVSTCTTHRQWPRRREGWERALVQRHRRSGTLRVRRVATTFERILWSCLKLLRSGRIGSWSPASRRTPRNQSHGGPCGSPPHIYAAAGRSPRPSTSHKIESPRSKAGLWIPLRNRASI